MSGSVLRLAIGLLVVGLGLSGCDRGAPATVWESEPDGSAIDSAIDTPAAQRLVGSFLRSSGASNDVAAVTLQRAGAPVTVYATYPSSADDSGHSLERAGIESYIAVPVRVAGRNAADTLQLEPSPPYLPRAMATGVEETSRPRAAGARLLLDYPTHTWFAWTRTHVTVISSEKAPALAGNELNAEAFYAWLQSR